MVTHPQGLRDHEQGGDDPAKDSCPHASPSWGFGDACRGIAWSLLWLRGREGVCSSANGNARRGKNPQDFPTGPPCAWLRLRWCFQLLAVVMSYFHLTATDSGSREGNRPGAEAAIAARCSPKAPCFPRHRASTPQSPPPVRDLSTLAQSPIGGPQENLPCASPPGAPPQLGGRSQVTLSPVFILLLEENSFRDRVTSLGRGGGHSRQRGADPSSGVVAMPSRHPTQLANRPQGHSLGHLGDVFVAQGDPQVVVLVQENLLDPGFPNATRLIPGKRAGSITVGMGLGGTQSPRCLGSREVGGHGGDMGALLGSASSGVKLFQHGFTSCLPVPLQLLNGGEG